jgi:hypothetical protein
MHSNLKTLLSAGLLLIFGLSAMSQESLINAAKKSIYDADILFEEG